MRFRPEDLQHYPINLDRLPTGWAVANVAAASVSVRPGFPSGKHNQDGRGAIHLRPMNISRDGTIDLSDVRYVEEARPERVERGDVLFNNTNSPALIGKTAPIRQPGDWAFSNHMTRIRPAEGINSHYLAHHLHYLWLSGYFRHRCVNHVNQASISSGMLATAIPLVIAPSAEQGRIVAVIEEQFSRIEPGVTALNRAHHNLGVMRAAVLTAAVTGRLLPGGEHSGDRIGGWDYQPLETLIKRLRNGVFVSRPVAEPVGPAILRISAVRAMSLDTTDVRFVPDAESIERLDEFVLNEGDLLFTRYSGNPEYVGACAIVPPGAPKLLYPDKLIRVQLDPVKADPRFIQIAAAAGRTRQEIRSRVKTTAGQTGISGSDLKSVRFPVPPLPVQKQIVGEVDRYLMHIAALDAEIAKGLTRSTSLRSSILACAFSGRLIPQDSKDEPATLLLARLGLAKPNTDSPRGALQRRAAVNPGRKTA